VRVTIHDRALGAPRTSLCHAAHGFALQKIHALSPAFFELYHIACLRIGSTDRLDIALQNCTTRRDKSLEEAPEYCRHDHKHAPCGLYTQCKTHLCISISGSTHRLKYSMWKLYILPKR